MSHSIPILVYHRIDDCALSTSTTPQAFREHLCWLSSRGWRSLSAGEFAFYAERGRNFPSRSFVLTFDDGYASIATAALPVLQELNYRAICFAATGFLWRHDDPSRSKQGGGEAFLSWQQARALQSGGLVELQSHTHTHRRLAHCRATDLESDLRKSLDMLTSELALPRQQFTHLAWPWGASDGESRRIAERCGFRFQYTVARAAFRDASYRLHVPRTCYDGTSHAGLQMQMWLQCGFLSKPWHLFYGMTRKLRHFRAFLPSKAAANAVEPARQQG